MFSLSLPNDGGMEGDIWAPSVVQQARQVHSDSPGFGGEIGVNTDESGRGSLWAHY